jgi:diacylglycerol kinase (ATP)
VACFSRPAVLQLPDSVDAACILFALEAVNTAIEVVVDKLSPEHSKFAKTVKDLGSAAVFFILSAGGLFLAAVTADSFGFVGL